MVENNMTDLEDSELESDFFLQELAEDLEEAKRAKAIQEDPQALFTTLVDTALAKNSASKFEYITSYETYVVTKVQLSGLNKVIKLFKSLETDTFNAYLKDIGTVEQDLNLLFSALKFEKCKKFYCNERAVAQEMIDEYRAYLKAGNWFKSVSGAVREESECYDFRRKR